MFCSSLQLYALNETVLGVVRGRKWIDMVQEAYQDFLGHMTHLSNLRCNPADPEDQLGSACYCEVLPASL